MAKKHDQKNYFDESGSLIVKPYRLVDLSAIYDVDRKTMRRWMNRYPEDLGIRDGKYFSIRQVQFCIDKFGLPGILPVTKLNQKIRPYGK